MYKKVATFLFFMATLMYMPLLWSAESTQSTEHTTVQLFSNGRDTVVARFDMEPDWHIYWSNPGEIGLPTTVKAQNANVKIDNQSVPQVRTVYEEMKEYLYENTAYFQLHLDNINTPEITFDFVECNDVCQPQSLTFDLSLIPSVDIAEWLQVKEAADATFPLKIQLSGNTDGQSLRLDGISADKLQFIPAERDVIAEESVDIEVHNGSAQISWQNETNHPLKQALIITPTENYIADIIYNHSSIWQLLYIILLAFIGGIILNTMPCVFPILSLKIFSLINQKHKNRNPVLNAVSYTAGVLLSFLLLTTILLILKSSGESIGWGFQLQSPWFVGIMAIIFYILFAFMVEWLRFPSFAGDFMHRAANLSEFSTGFFAVLIASPCTGPFMGAAIGYAFMHGSYELYAVFTALALGYALPYALIELYPQFINRIMPKPGQWMRRIKIVLSVPILLTAFWLSAVLFEQLTIDTENTAAETTEALQWQPYDEKIIAELNEQGENIFIDFTADWCLTCKFNEKILINTLRFKKFVQENNVHLFMADMTDYNDEYNEALNMYGRDGIPLYIYYKNGSYEILPLFFSISDLQK
ncbi:MAG: thioredoxin family protein [Alphaproteobacteria bacterium]